LPEPHIPAPGILPGPYRIIPHKVLISGPSGLGTPDAVLVTGSTVTPDGGGAREREGGTMDVQMIVALGLPIWLGVEEIVHRSSALKSDSATPDETDGEANSPEEILRQAA